MQSISFWTNLANQQGILVGSTTYCVNTTFVNIGLGDIKGDNFTEKVVSEWSARGHFFFDPPEPLALPVMRILDIEQKTNLLVDGNSPRL